MSDTTSTGLAPGFGGFATTAGGQLQYWNRQHNPYAFLQSQQDIVGDTAPAASQELAGGGLAGVNPQQEQAWAKFMRYHQMSRYRRGGMVRLSDGGDATEGGQASTNGGGDQSGNETGQTGGGGYGTSEGPGAATSPPGADNISQASGYGAVGPGGMHGFSATDEANIGHAAFGTLGANNMGMEQTAPDQAPLGPVDPQDPTAAQMGYAGAKAAIGSGISSMAGISGLGGLATKAADALGLSPSNLGIGEMSAGAKAGSQAGSMVGGLAGTAIGGPIGGAIGAGLGAAIGSVAGAHGEQGNGALSGSFGGGSGMGTTSATATAAGSDPVSSATDLTTLIKKINDELQAGSVNASPGPKYAGGGSVRGPSMPNHAFHKGSGLVRGTSDGRADALHTHVPQGSYVVPADVVSGLGQGNTMAGAKKLAGLMPQNTPPQPDDPGMAGGGMVPVRLSAGEFHIHPAHVAALGGGNLKAGSDKLDTMVGHVRTANARQIATMPPPR